MKEVIVDIPRARGGDRSRPRVELTDESAPPVLHERMRIVDDGKSQRDRTSPLRKFLASCVGRPWVKVWSEICEHADARTVLGFHLRTHAREYVDTTCTVDRDGVVWRTPGEQYRKFWVDPRNGLLRRAPARRKRLPKRPDPAAATRLALPGGRACERIDGQWYETRIITREEYVRRLAKDRSVTLVQSRRQVVAKRQLSREEKRALGVS